MFAQHVLSEHSPSRKSSNGNRGGMRSTLLTGNIGSSTERHSPTREICIDDSMPIDCAAVSRSPANYGVLAPALAEGLQHG
jgi:hypothetical protein